MLDNLNEDFRDLLTTFADHAVEFLVVGAYAVAFHGVPRTTGDIDVFTRPSGENAGRVWAALTKFGAPLEANRITEQDFTIPGMIYQIGLPPRRIDVMTEISGVTFDEAWSGRVGATLGAVTIYFIGRDHLLRNKRAAGRAKDLADLERFRS